MVMQRMPYRICITEWLIRNGSYRMDHAEWAIQNLPYRIYHTERATHRAIQTRLPLKIVSIVYSDRRSVYLQSRPVMRRVTASNRIEPHPFRLLASRFRLIADTNSGTSLLIYSKQNFILFSSFSPLLSAPDAFDTNPLCFRENTSF